MTDESPRNDKQDDASWRRSLVIGGLALSIPTMLFGPPIVGYYLDQSFGTTPWLFLAMLAVGFIGTAIDVKIILNRVKMLS